MTFSHIHPLINQIIDPYIESECHQKGQKSDYACWGIALQHTLNTYATLLRCHEENGSRLLRVV